MILPVRGTAVGDIYYDNTRIGGMSPSTCTGGTPGVYFNPGPFTYEGGSPVTF